MKTLLVGIALAAAGLCQQQTADVKAVVERIYKDDKRMQKAKLPVLVDALGLKPGSSVADIGCGDGKFTVVLAHVAGKDGRVYAVDVDRNALKDAKKAASKEKLKNVTFLQGTDEDPKLTPESLDAALASVSYHHFEKPQAMLAKIKAALKPGGRFVVVEMLPVRTRTQPRKVQTDAHRIDPDLVQKELEAAGFKVVKRDEAHMDYPDDEEQHYLIVATH